MAGVSLALSAIGGIGSLVCLIMVLLKLFPAEGALKGVLGIICGLYTFVWGWMNKDRFNLGTIMIVWTVCIVLTIIANFLGAGAAVQMSN